MKTLKEIIEIVAYQKDEQGEYTLIVRQPNGYYIAMEGMHSFGLKNILENNDVLKLEHWVQVRTWIAMMDNEHEEEVKEEGDVQSRMSASTLGDLDALTELKEKMTQEPKPIIDHSAALNPDKMKVLGYYVVDTVGTEDGYDDSPEPNGSLDYHIVLEGGYEFVIGTQHGMCGSGYCPATWGGLDSKIKKVEGSLAMMTKVSKSPIWITTQNDRKMVYFNEQDSNEYDDAMVTTVRCSNNEVLCHETGDGGCGYYPSGYGYINDKLFTEI